MELGPGTWCEGCGFGLRGLLWLGLGRKGVEECYGNALRDGIGNGDERRTAGLNALDELVRDGAVDGLQCILCGIDGALVADDGRGAEQANLAGECCSVHLDGCLCVVE